MVSTGRGHGGVNAHDHADCGGGLADILDLDGEVLHAYWADALAWVRRAVGGSRRRRLVDLGCGTGTATIGLAQRFLDADVVAVDASEQMLERVRVKALENGLASRIRTVLVDLNDGWPDVGEIDLTWASMSLHHLRDPDRLLRELFAATRSGGLVAVAELAEPLTFLPDDLGVGRPGLEARCLDALWGRQQFPPEVGADWARRLGAAGFVVTTERTMSIAIDPPHTAATVRYATRSLRRTADAVGDVLADDDCAVLARLVDGDGPEALHRRTDLRLRGRRVVTLARRP